MEHQERERERAIQHTTELQLVPLHLPSLPRSRRNGPSALPVGAVEAAPHLPPGGAVPAPLP